MKRKDIIEKLITIGVFIGLIWGAFSYLDRFALCETTEKKFQMIEEAQKKQMEYFDQKTNKMEKYFDLKILAQELKLIEEQIYQIEKEFGVSPKSASKRADLEKLRRDRERIMNEMKAVQKK